MADEYQNAVKKLVDYIGDTVNFAKDQLPDVAKEILTYSATIDHFWLGGWLFMAIIGFIVFIIGLMSDEEGKQFFGGVMLVAGLIFMGITYSDLIKIDTAPKLYILDEMKSKLPK